MGYLKAIGMTKMHEANSSPTAFTGILWLVTSILLMATIGLWIKQANYWWILGGLSLLLSQALIINAWPEAKFGTLPNILLLVAVILGFAQSNYTANNNALQKQIITTASATPFQSVPVAQLPNPVRKWLNTSGALDQDTPEWVMIRQELKMKLSPDQKEWYDAKADQVVTLGPPAFQWSVDMRMNAFAYVFGQDIFTNGSGSTLMKLWGLIPVARAGNDPKTNEAALQRYLAEIVWYPVAATSRLVEWKQLDDLSAEATITVNGLRGSGVFHFTEEGDFQKFTAQRYKGAGPSDERIPWVINVLERGSLNGVKVPLRVEVTWITPEGPWTWLEVRVTEQRYHHKDREKGK
jgi:hypothetical protein